MTQKPIQLAVITNQPERAEMVDSASGPLGWQVSANSGHMQPLNWLLSQSADVALIDLDLPHAAQLVADLALAMPLLTTLALAMPERLVDLQAVMLAGAKDFVALPINVDHFSAVVERVLMLPAPVSAVHRFDGAQQTPMQLQLSSPQPPPAPQPPTLQPPALQPLQASPDVNGLGLVAGGMNLNGMTPGLAPLQANGHHINGHHINGNHDSMGIPQPLAKHMIAVVGLRGGVGRSTIAVNLAMALQQRDLGGVALVEAHHGLSHLSVMLHLHPRNTLAGLADALSLDVDVVRGHLQAHGSGVNVLAAPSHFDDLVELSGEQWATILELIQEVSPIMIVDTSAAADSALLETLVQATDILVVVNPEIASLRSTTALVNNLYTESEVQGNVHVVLNRAGVGGGLDEGTIRKQLGHDLTATLPDDASLATYAMNRGVPFVTSHARSLLTKRINALADQIVTGAQAPVDTKMSMRSFLPFLSS